MLSTTIGLDDVGHGMRSSSSSTPRSRRSASSVGMPPPVHQPPTSAGPAPTTKPPTPPQANRSVSSLSRGSREYRTPPAVAPPQVGMLNFRCFCGVLNFRFCEIYVMYILSNIFGMT